ncbi:MAG: hypothetical protein M1828_004367 [Chrysothrix sp. TS-e1954]|nr:MAG: hypothetical protein M1828_004367 [Chrysothrix sp. TS-e1954]
MTATTALTAQNTLGVAATHLTPSHFVEKQIDACIGDIGIDIVKIGMLASSETIHIVANALRRHAVKKIVLDPVMVATSGAQLLPVDAVQYLRIQLLPIVTLLTPNIPEAMLLLKDQGSMIDAPKSVQELINIAQAVQELGPQWVLLKGGHLPLDGATRKSTGSSAPKVVVDILHGDGETIIMETERIDSNNTHGTGCSLASAVACNLAQGYEMEKAVRSANAYVQAGIKTNEDLGKGSGPINHFHSAYTLPFAPIQNELRLHLVYCEQFGLSRDAVEDEEESQACVAYIRYMLDIGHSEDWLALQVAFVPCLLGYAEIARRLHDDPETRREDNPYWEWIRAYVDEDYVATVKTGKELIERHAVNLSPHRIQQLAKIVIQATKMEIGFWDMGLQA